MFICDLLKPLIDGCGQLKIGKKHPPHRSQQEGYIGSFILLKEIASNLAIKVLLCNLQLIFQNLLPHVWMYLSASSGDFCSLNCPIRHDLTIKIVVGAFIAFPAIPLTETLQFFPSWHMISSSIASVSRVIALKTYGICPTRFGALLQRAYSS